MYQLAGDKMQTACNTTSSQSVCCMHSSPAFERCLRNFRQCAQVDYRFQESPIFNQQVNIGQEKPNSIDFWSNLSVQSATYAETFQTQLMIRSTSGNAVHKNPNILYALVCLKGGFCCTSSRVLTLREALNELHDMTEGQNIHRSR